MSDNSLEDRISKIIVEQLGSTCHACLDGEEACTDLVLELTPTEIELDFDASISGC